MGPPPPSGDPQLALGRLPPGFGDQLGGMRFFQTPEGTIQLADIRLEALLAEKEGREGGDLYKILEYRTGLNERMQPTGLVDRFQMPQKLRNIRSICQPYR
jgi:hypothetical protein